MQDGARVDRPITVTLADDESHVLEYVRTVLEFDGFEVLGTAHDAAGAIRLAQALRPDVAILDLYMPGSGLTAAQTIADSTPNTHVMVLSAESDGREVLPLLRAGIDGYVVKGCTPNQLTQAIRDVVAGGLFLSPEVTRAAVGELTSRLQDEADEMHDIRERQARVVDTIEHRRFAIHFQPILQLSDGRTHAVEALARFSALPTRTPNEWFAEASDLGLRTSLEIATALAALSELDRLHPELRQSVNLSPEAALSGQLAALLDGVEPDRVVLELTEHAPVHDYPALRAALRPWRTQGARLAIDDAGGGYASLRHILNLVPDYIKLDVDLTRHIESDPERQALARALIGFADELGASVIAEGVESAAQMEALRLLGTHFVQGYHVGRPLPLDEQPNLLAEPTTVIDLAGGLIDLRPDERTSPVRPRT